MLVKTIHQQHLDLRELFARHQEALLQGDLEKAITELDHFAACLKVHIQLEDSYLLPEFAKIERSTKWDVSLYEKEHEKIKHLHQTIHDDLNWLSEQQLDESQLRRNIIALLDKEKTFKGLNEHHEDREEDALLKELDQKLEERQRKILQHDLKHTWAEVKASITET